MYQSHYSRGDVVISDPAVDVDHVTKTFRGGIRALDGLSLSVHPGTVHGLLGPNGAGKTTLIRVLTTLLRPDSGTVRVVGVDVRADPGTVRTLIGLAGQYAAVDGHLTGMENVEMTGRLYGLRPAESRRRSTEVLERIGLSDAADRLVKTYSGGMRRRLDLAASLVGRPRVLLLDEPTSGLDPASRRDLWDLIRLLLDDGTTVLLTTQYLDEADQLADRITVIDDGRVIGEGSPDDLKTAVGGATVEISVDGGDLDRALNALHPFGARTVGSPGRMTIQLPAVEGSVTLQQVLHELNSSGVGIDDISLRRPTLDDVFLSLTGHRTAAGTASEKDAA